MEIPLRLKISPDGRLSYGIPLWYRLICAAMLLLVAGGLVTSEASPGFTAWIVLGLLALGTLYEERWIVDPQSKTIRHSNGFLPFAKARVIPFAESAEFRLTVLARGTVPGSTEEESEKSRAYLMLRGRDKDELKRGAPAFLSRKKPYINLMMTSVDGSNYLIDSLPARHAGRLLVVGKAMSEACGVRFFENGED
jgi:hypothetical protein